MKKLILLFVFVPMFLFSQSKREQKKYSEIVDLIEQNELELAREQTNKLLEKNKEWKKPHLLLSQISIEEQDFEDAEIEFFNYYNKNSVSSFYPVFLLAEMFYKEGEYVIALRNFYLSATLSGEENKHKRYIDNCRFAIDSKENLVEFEFENMGENINSEFSEYLPFISADGNDFIFTRLIENEKGELQEDFYQSKNNNGIWNKAIPMEINTPQNEGSVSVAVNGDFLIYTACNREDGQGRCDLYICVKQMDGSWSKAENLSNINTRYWESQACFSPDMKYLYFVSDRRGGFGGDDIWRSEITKFGFSEPENLGPIINTLYDEMSPFLHPDNLTFYFASEGHTGLGDFDVFVSKRRHSDTLWSDPENLGYPINTHNTENSLVVSSDGRTAYFVSDKSGFGMEDIFSFQLPEGKQAEKISNLEMDILSETSGGEIILDNVLFETDSYQLIKSSFSELDALLDYLQKNPKVKIHIEGHTDNVGDKEYNQELSQNRAKEVCNYLQDRGVSPKRLTYKGYGESIPITTNKTEKGRSKNRRTSFIFLR
ncbi:MAG: OmpA family protein [Flavobacteriales bacterium]|nr:OmpA family protein [Flavobacteriales bacterium]